MTHVDIAIDAQDEEVKADHARKVITLCPDSAIAYCYLGESLLRVNPVEAGAAYDHAMQLGDPSVAKEAKVRRTMVR